MALFTPSCLISEIRGSVGTSNFSKNAYGPIVRQKLTQTNPSSVRQTIARDNFSVQVKKWATLTQAQRDYYILNARDIVNTNSLGVKHNPTGFSLFVSRSLNLSLVDWPNDPTFEFFSPIPGFSNLRIEGTGADKVFAWDTTPGSFTWRWIVSVSAPMVKTKFKLNPSWLRYGVWGAPNVDTEIDLDTLYQAAFNQGFPNIPDLVYFFGLSYVDIVSGQRTPVSTFRYFIP